MVDMRYDTEVSDVFHKAAKIRFNWEFQGPSAELFFIFEQPAFFWCFFQIEELSQNNCVNLQPLLRKDNILSNKNKYNHYGQNRNSSDHCQESGQRTP
jgi:hypothetical protein